MTEAPHACPPEPILERHLAGDLSGTSKYASHVSTCPLCAERLAKMRASGEAYMESDAARALGRALIERDRRTARRRAFGWWSAAVPLAAAAAWLLFFRTPAPSDLTAKGGGSVELLVGHGGAAQPWTGGALAAGDLLQLSWTSGEGGYVAVIGREEGGPTVRWFPAKEARAVRLDPGTRAFGDGLRFDPPFRGTVFAFVAEQPFATDGLETAIRQGRDPTFAGKTLKLQVPRTP